MCQTIKMIMIVELCMFSYHFARNKTSCCLRKNPLIINLKGKLQSPFDFFLRYQTRRISIVHLLVKYHMVFSCGGIGQLTFLKFHFEPEAKVDSHQRASNKGVKILMDVFNHKPCVVLGNK